MKVIVQAANRKRYRKVADPLCRPAGEPHYGCDEVMMASVAQACTSFLASKVSSNRGELCARVVGTRESLSTHLHTRHCGRP